MTRGKLANMLLARLKQRVTGMRSIQPKLDLQGGISVAAGEKLAAEYGAGIEAFYAAEQQLASARARLRDLRSSVRDFNERALAGVLTRWGKDSEEYGRMGGTRKSDRKAPRRGARKPREKAPAAAKTASARSGAGDGVVEQSNGHA